MADKKAFTLVELIVGVTISMLLMTSVGVLVSGGMQNILKQQKIMQKNSLLTTSVSDFYNGFNTITQSGGYITRNNSGALFKIDQNIQKGGFGYFGLISQDNKYCPADSDLPTFNYLSWKTFVPYEEIGEDIMSNYSGSLKQTVSSGSTTYTVDTLNHKIYENNGGGDTLIIGGEVYGYVFSNGASGKYISLNNPSGIVLAEGGFFFSDTLNNRVLFYENGVITLVLDKNDGLSEPTGLAYDSTENALYIANSGKGEILKYSSTIITSNPDLSISFTPKTDINNITRFTLDFPNISGNITFPTNTGSFSFTNITQSEDYLENNNTQLNYYFTDYVNSSATIVNGNIPGCSDSSIVTLNGNTPEKTITTCTSTNTGSIYTYDGNINQNFSRNTNYQILVQNIAPFINTPGNNLVDLELFNLGNSQYKETFAYFTQGDGLVKNGENMTLSVFANNLQYPTGLELNAGNTALKINEFISRNILTYNMDGSLNSTNSTTLLDFSANNFTQFNYSALTDTILENPVSSISMNYDSGNKYFSSNLKYYQFINCYNPDEKVEKSLIFSKSLK